MGFSFDEKNPIFTNKRDTYDPKRKFDFVLRLAAMQAAAVVHHHDSDATLLWIVVSDSRCASHGV